MYDGFNKIYWGTIIVTFGIQAGPIRILPSTLGAIFIILGITLLYDNTHIQSFKKAQYYGTVHVFLTLIAEIRKFALLDLGELYIFDQAWILFGIMIQILMYFKIFEGAIIIINSNNKTMLADYFTGRLRFYIITSLLNIMIMTTGLIFSVASVSIVSILVLLGLNLLIIFLVKKIRDMFPEEKNTVVQE